MSSTTNSHIEMQQSAIHGEKACIVGTRIRVEDIYVLHELEGISPHDIVLRYPQITLADVHAALAYYWDNRDAIQKQLKQGDAIAGSVEAAIAPKLPARMDDLRMDADSISP